MSISCPSPSQDTGVNLKKGTKFNLPSAWGKKAIIWQLRKLLISLSVIPTSQLISGYIVNGLKIHFEISNSNHMEIA